MDDAGEIEDIVGNVQYTDSQKSIDTSHVYSMDFTDSSNSDKQNSLSKETYIIDASDDDSEMYPLGETKSILNIASVSKDNFDRIVKSNLLNQVSRSIPNCSIVPQEIFTQTSRTIFELAQASIDTNNLETQTSFMSVIETKTVEYRIGVKAEECNESSVQFEAGDNKALEKVPSKSLVTNETDSVSREDSNEENERIIHIIQDQSSLTLDNDNMKKYENNSTSGDNYDSDMEEDSLMERNYEKERKVTKDIDNDSDITDVPTSVDEEIEELYHKLSETIDFSGDLIFSPAEKSSRLTTVSEETSNKAENVIDITPDDCNIVKSNEKLDDDMTLFTDETGFKVKMLPMEKDKNKEVFKLPPIQSNVCPTSPFLNYLFTVNTSDRLNNVDSRPRDRWEFASKELAGSESELLSQRNEQFRQEAKETVHLPPIHIEGYVINSEICKNNIHETSVININSTFTPRDSISIQGKIKELKMHSRSKHSQPKEMLPLENKSRSSNYDEVKLETAERGCEALTQEFLRKLRSSTWVEVMETLDEIPKMMEKFWEVITENRIADLIRQVNIHIDSPWTQVVRAACNTVAVILKNTNYTKKPDFYETVTILLTKTGSYSRPVRRAANLALDEIVCAIDISHAITALCVHGACHKSATVRSAAARLLVVCCGMRGGRGVLRNRPPTAATARRYALRALASLLDDKNTEARKYAERFYSILRSHNSFEAYYLTDVDVEVASRQMKKYDKLLFCSQSKEIR